MTIINLKSSDNKDFHVEFNILKKSQVIKDMIDDLGIDVTSGDSLPDYIPLIKVSSEFFEVILKWLVYYKDENFGSEDDEIAGAAGPSTANERTDEVIVPEWDRDLFHSNDDRIFDLMICVNYLNIKTLLDRLCKYKGSFLKDKTAEQIRQMFNIKNDFTPEEEEEMKNAFDWCEDL